MVKKYVAWYLVVAMFVIGIAPRVEAAFSPSEAVAIGPAARAGNVETIRIALENKLVAQRLQDLGYTGEEIMARLSQLTDEQIHSFAQKIDEVKVGQDGFGVVIFLLVVIILVIVILQLTGRRVIVGR